jgi:hypothetical protein
MPLRQPVVQPVVAIQVVIRRRQAKSLIEADLDGISAIWKHRLDWNAKLGREKTLWPVELSRWVLGWESGRSPTLNVKESPNHFQAPSGGLVKSGLPVP